MKNSYLLGAVCACVFAFITTTVNAFIVSMETSLGVIDIELFDNEAPITVANFMNYVNDGDYDNSFFHRSVPGFILQGGGFRYDDQIPAYSYVPEDAPIINEFDVSRSNVRGTLAMAKIGGDPDSATSQWFFNLYDNSANLDSQNGGFTVFGQVLGNGMDIVDAIAALPTYNITAIHSAFTDVPLNGYAGTYDPANQLVFVNNVSVSTVAPAWGDINDDGYTNVIDVLIATQGVLGATLSNEQLSRGNVAPLVNGIPQPVDPHEPLDVADLLLITRKALGTEIF
jgi:cyclophilin family peptidyl-prolyl cis-trans isomerase